jgi:hypothetical protein
LNSIVYRRLGTVGFLCPMAISVPHQIINSDVREDRARSQGWAGRLQLWS